MRLQTIVKAYFYSPRRNTISRIPHRSEDLERESRERERGSHPFISSSTLYSPFPSASRASPTTQEIRGGAFMASRGLEKVGDTKANLVVAKDGSGNFDKIVDAVKAAPNNSNIRFVIHIKTGTYRENVLVGIEKTNIKFLGDGIGKTVLTADRNAKHGFQIDTSATLGVDGFGFLAQDLTIENTSGPENGQAVALRSGSDHSAFYRCSFRGYQDTLYVQRNKQFYRECDVFGTIDFIFGDAAVVLQKCNMFARKPLENQAVVFTDQGRDNLQSKTGISIHECKFLADAALVPVLPKFKVYLGRPWKKFSRVVILRSFIDTLIDPAGWLETNSNFDNTVFYREYMNNGPGSNTANRVKWSGYKVFTDAAEANQFTVASFIDGNQWLGATSIPFTPGLV